jgi:uncharacterized integral membrane protein
MTEQSPPPPSDADPQPVPPPSAVPIPAAQQRSRSGAVYVGLVITALLLILLLVFIGQNSRSVTIHFLGLRGHISLAIALLLSAVAGVLLAAIPASVRILQLRSALRRVRRQSS